MRDTAILELDAEARLLIALRFAVRDLDAVRARLAELHQGLMGRPGLLGIDVVSQASAFATDLLVTGRFADRDALEAWKRLPVRASLLAPLEALTISDVARREGQGRCIWFEPLTDTPAMPAAPPLWKRWAVIMLAVYPALVVLIFACAGDGPAAAAARAADCSGDPDGTDDCLDLAAPDASARAVAVRAVIERKRPWGGRWTGQA